MLAQRRHRLDVLQVVLHAVVLRRVGLGDDGVLLHERERDVGGGADLREDVVGVERKVEAVVHEEALGHVAHDEDDHALHARGEGGVGCGSVLRQESHAIHLTLGDQCLRLHRARLPYTPRD